MVGVTVVTLFTVFGDSLKASASNAVGQSLRADIVVDTPGYGGQTGSSGFAPQLAHDIASVPGVQSVTGVRGGNALIDGQTHAVTVIDPQAAGRVLDLDVTAGALADLDAGSIAVSTDTASSHGWRTGSTTAVTFPDGKTSQVTIGAIYGHRGFVGDFLLSPSAWSPHTSQAIDRQELVELEPGTDATAAKSAIATAAKPYGDARVQTAAEYKSTAAAGVDTILGLIYVMLALAIVIALMGIANTLSLSIYERTRELGLLRAVGQTRRQTRSMVRWESVLIAVFGTIGGIALGTFLGWALVEAALTADFGTFSISPVQLVVFLVVGAIAGTLAGIRPARRAARLDLLDAINAE
jgi:putative ABC transport system permease protein